MPGPRAPPIGALCCDRCLFSADSKASDGVKRARASHKPLLGAGAGASGTAVHVKNGNLCAPSPLPANVPFACPCPCPPAPLPTHLPAQR